MAVRNPTSFVQYQDSSGFMSGKPILSSPADDIVNDQIFTLDAESLGAIWFPGAISTTSSSFVTVGRIYIRNKDMCDEVTVTNHEIPCVACFYGASSLGGVTARLKLTSTAIASNTVTMSGIGGAFVPEWVGFSSSFNVKTNDIEDVITVEMRDTVGSAFALYAIGIFALET